MTYTTSGQDYDFDRKNKESYQLGNVFRAVFHVIHSGRSSLFNR